MRMLLSGFAAKLESEAKSRLVGTFMVANAFVWYLSAFKFLQANFTESSLLLIVSINLGCLVVTAFAVTLLLSKFRQRLVFLKYWVLAGLPFSAFYMFLNFNSLLSCAVASGFLGFYFGLGMPICMGYFAAGTRPEKRAKSGAVIILMIGLGFPILSSIDGSQVVLVASALTVWRFLALATLFAFRPPERIAEAKNTVSYRAVIGNKTFLLYLVPWFMFVLINELAMQINADYFKTLSAAFSSNYLVIENVLSGVSAILCGLLADRKGRKRIALVGFALLGLGYAALGVSNGSSYAVSAAWFYIAADGIAWGAFSMLFLITIWGDIAQEKNSEKYYFIGVLPYLISNLMGLTMGTFISENMLEGTVFSFASFFLFIAILPLAYAPETLSDKILSSLDINHYVTKALKKANKESPKMPQKAANAEDEEEGEDREKSPEAEEAAKLAEKYYY